MVFNVGNHWKLLGHGPILSHSSHPPGIVSFHHSQFVKDWEFEFHIVGSWETLCSKLMNGKGFAVRDGSYKHCKVLQSGSGMAPPWPIELWVNALPRTRQQSKFF